MDHIISVSTGGGVRLFVNCACDPERSVGMVDRPTATLAELNELAHEHITAAENPEPRT